MVSSTYWVLISYIDILFARLVLVRPFMIPSLGEKNLKTKINSHSTEKFKIVLNSLIKKNYFAK
jgi:hypothetical protein